jgi:hypothetical protein
MTKPILSRFHEPCPKFPDCRLPAWGGLAIIAAATTVTLLGLGVRRGQ